MERTLVSTIGAGIYCNLCKNALRKHGLDGHVLDAGGHGHSHDGGGANSGAHGGPVAKAVAPTLEAAVVMVMALTLEAVAGVVVAVVAPRIVAAAAVSCSGCGVFNAGKNGVCKKIHLAGSNLQPFTS